MSSILVASRLNRLRAHELSREVTGEAISLLAPLFGHSAAVGVEMAIRAAGLDADPDTISASMTALVADRRAVS